MRPIVLFCCAAAVLAAAAAVVAPGHTAAALVVSVAMLVCAQVVAMMAARTPGEVDDARFASLAQRIARNAADIDQLRTRTRDQAQKVAELHQSLTRQKPRVLDAQQPGAPVQAPPERVTRAVDRSPVLHLEPVVTLHEGRTAYYKASIQELEAGAIPFISADLSLASGQAYRWSAQQGLDLLQQVMPVLSRLRARGGASGIFVPVCLSTLESGDWTGEIATVLEQWPDAVSGLAFDLHVTALGALTGPAVHNLSWLVKRGARFCLTGPGAAGHGGEDLARLGFAFMDVHATELVAANGQLSPQAARLMQAAAAHGITLMAHGVSDPAQAVGLVQAVTLGRGRHFSLPRAVRAQPDTKHQTRQVA